MGSDGTETYTDSAGEGQERITAMFRQVIEYVFFPSYLCAADGFEIWSPFLIKISKSSPIKGDWRGSESCEIFEA
jgi:hypothetical protein